MKVTKWQIPLVAGYKAIYTSFTKKLGQERKGYRNEIISRQALKTV